MRWRPHTEKPEPDVMSGVIACPDPQGAFLLGVKLWRNGQWVDEDDGFPVKSEKFWWIPESEVVATLPRKGKRSG